jgi:hypothetical protein
LGTVVRSGLYCYGWRSLVGAREAGPTTVANRLYREIASVVDLSRSELSFLGADF